MAAKPTVGGSSGSWGTELNAFLDVSLDSNGTIKQTELDTKTFWHASSAVVFNNASLTAANTFQDLDLSSVVGVNSAFVFLQITTNGGYTFAAKPKGVGGTYLYHLREDAGYDQGSTFHFATSGDYGYFPISTDSSGVIQIGSNTNTGKFTITILGYIK